MDIRDTIYYRQVDLLLQILPEIAKIDEFALKGGTAINLFVRDLPRLSMDIDLTYVPVKDRETSLNSIHNHLQNIFDRCQSLFPDDYITKKQQKGLLFGLIITHGGASVKIEPNTTIRGTVFPPVHKILSPKTEELFGRSVKVQTLSIEDLYGGKLCAAMDRQHPRDLFDVYFLYKNEGLTDKIRQAFLVYLLSHNRPISELLAPQLKDNLDETYHETFEGMMFDPVSLDELIDVWKQAVEKLNRDFTDDEREFLLSFKRKSPQWDLFPVKGIQHLPAVKWKMLNLKKMRSQKHEAAFKKLEKILRS